MPLFVQAHLNLCLRLDISKELTLPTVDELIQPDGRISLSDNLKWAEVAAKINVARHSTSEQFQAQISSKVTSVSEKQEKLATVVFDAIQKVLLDSTPQANEAMNAALASFVAQVHDWPSSVATLTKLSEMNLRKWISFDVPGILGPESGKVLARQLDRMTETFAVCASGAEWMKLVLAPQ